MFGSFLSEETDFIPENISQDLIIFDSAKQLLPSTCSSHLLVYRQYMAFLDCLQFDLTFFQISGFDSAFS